MILGRSGGPEGSPASSVSNKEAIHKKTPMAAPRRGSAPETLQSVRELTSQIDQPAEEEMKQMLKAYSSDGGGSEDEHPTAKERKIARRPEGDFLVINFEGNRR